MGIGMSKYEVKHNCNKLNLPINCSIFRNSSIPIFIGNKSKGNFEPGPNIAGKGVSEY